MRHALCWSGSTTHIPVLPGAEVLLCPLDAAETPAELVDALLERARLFGQGRRFCRRDGPRFGLDHDVKVDELLRERRHVVGEAERVLADLVGRKDVVALPFSLALDDDRVGRICHDPIDIKRPS